MTPSRHASSSSPWRKVFLPGVAVFLLFAATALGGENAGKVFLVPFDGPVDLGRKDFVERAIDEAIEKKAGVILLAIDSPGGRVDYTEEILGALERARTAGIRTVAWIKGNAWSAAAIIATACDRIYVKGNASLGAAQPIFMTGEGVEEAGEKFVSAMRTEARANAERTGRPAALAEAMVDPDTEVYEVLDRGKRKFLTALEWKDLREKSYREGFEVVVESTVIEKGKLLSLTARKALDYGYVDGEAASLDRVLETEGLATAEVIEFELSWSQHLANFLTLPLVSMVLLILGIAGIYVEIKAPGFGVPGILGAACLFLLFFGKYSVGLAEIHEILLFLAGIVLILVEVFVTPGFGVPGIAGAVLIVAGLLLSSQDFVIPATELQQRAFFDNVVRTLLSMGGAVVALVFLGAVLPRTPLFRRLELRAPSLEESQGGSAVQRFDENLEGLAGTAETALRPAGRGLFGARRLDIVTEGDYVEAGTPIRIYHVEGNRIVVVPEETATEDREERE